MNKIVGFLVTGLMSCATLRCSPDAPRLNNKSINDYNLTNNIDLEGYVGETFSFEKIKITVSDIEGSIFIRFLK